MDPRRKHFLIVGANAAGLKAASKARRRDPQLAITVVERDATISFAGCGLPYYVGGVVTSREDLIGSLGGALRTPKWFAEFKDITVLTGHEATRIRCEKKTVAVRVLETGDTREFPYDVLLLATGASAVKLSAPGVDLAGVSYVKRLEDADAIKADIDSGRVKNAVVVGGGYIGVEMAEALVGCGVKTTLIEAADQILSPFDADIAALVARHMRAKGVTIHLGEKAERFEGEGGRVRALVTGRRRLEADLVVMGVGVRPNVELARQAGLALGETGAIAVDDHLRTSDPDIYAAGDCVENRCLVTGGTVYVPLGSTANKHGRVVGINVTGGDDTFPGVVSTIIVKAFDFTAARTGLSARDASRRGVEFVSVTAPGLDRAHYYPEAKAVVIKLLAELRTGRLLGAQMVGPGDVARRIDVAATALTSGMTVKQLSALDLAYAPPYSPALDPLITAANVLRNKLEDPSVALTPAEVKAKLDGGEDFVLLDVRTPGEYAEVRIPGATLLPLGELRSRLQELPHGKEIVTFCRVSLRGWEAASILRNAGFTKAKFLEGGVTAWPYDLEPQRRK
jgi:NADPH-dependent 2,4-dienoyl-CoA reductase/sulfur reductase-like enzyme/rhodanese-related sulfurtransferase